MALTPVSNVGTIDTITVGGRIFTDITNLKHLVAFADGGNRSTFRLHSGTSGYTPSGATAFNLRAVRVLGQNTAAQPSAARVSRTSNDVGMNGATAFAGEAPFGGSTAIFFASAGAGVDSSLAVDFTVSNTNYLSMQTAGSTNTLILAYGYEV